MMQGYNRDVTFVDCILTQSSGNEAFIKETESIALFR